MKVVILAGGFGTRISEETHLKPKPMVDLHGRPIIWHIMKYYSSFGFNEFVVCAGYKANYIKRYFRNYFYDNSDFVVNTSKNETQITKNPDEHWSVHVVDTGLNVNTGGRVGAVKNIIGDDTFMLTYGDGLANVNIKELIEFHKKNRNICTLTAVSPPARFGLLEINKNNKITKFSEKPSVNEERISGGFFVCEPKVLDLIEGPNNIFEVDVLPKLAASNDLGAYQHNGFWQCMDSLRDKQSLEKMITDKNAPWKVW